MLARLRQFIIIMFIMFVATLPKLRELVIGYLPFILKNMDDAVVLQVSKTLRGPYVRLIMLLNVDNYLTQGVQGKVSRQEQTIESSEPDT